MVCACVGGGVGEVEQQCRMQCVRVCVGGCRGGGTTVSHAVCGVRVCGGVVCRGGGTTVSQICLSPVLERV